MEFVFGAVSVIIIIAALLYFRKLYIMYINSRKQTLVKKTASSGTFVNCPVCSTPLTPGQNLVSKVFGKVGKADDQLCYVYGCPSCYPDVKPGIKRICPVCHKEISQDGYLLSRMFNKTKSGKPHVIINGCGNCSGKR